MLSNVSESLFPAIARAYNNERICKQHHGPTRRKHAADSGNAGMTGLAFMSVKVVLETASVRKDWLSHSMSATHG